MRDRFRSTTRPPSTSSFLTSLLPWYKSLNHWRIDLARVVPGRSGDPALHAQEAEQLLVVVEDLEQLGGCTFAEVADRVHHQEREADRAQPGELPDRVDQRVDVVPAVERARPQVHVAGAAHRRVDVAVEVDRRHGQHQSRHLSREQRGVAGREDAALADAHQVDLLDALALTHDIDAIVEIASRRSRRSSASAAPASGCPSRGSRASMPSASSLRTNERSVSEVDHLVAADQRQ